MDSPEVTNQGSLYKISKQFTTPAKIFSFVSPVGYLLSGRSVRDHPNLGETPGTSTPLCLVLSLTYGHWYARNCLTILPYICKVPAVSSHAPAPTQCPSGWIYLSSSKKCYKVRQISWSRNFPLLPPSWCSMSRSMKLSFNAKHTVLH